MTEIAAPSSPGPAAPRPLPSRESYSSLSTYEACPRRYVYRYVERLPGEVPRTWFTFGSAVHAAFAAFDRARIAARRDDSAVPGYDVVETAFREALDASGCDPEEIARYDRRGAPVLRTFLDRESASDAEPVGVEVGFGIDVPVADDEPTVRFAGYVDRIDRRPDGTIEIIDHKTGSARPQAEVDCDQQLTAYAFAGARGGLRDPTDGSVLPAPARLALHFAEPGTTAWTTRSTDELDAFGDRLGRAVRDIRRRAFAAKSGSACRWCEYGTTCPDVAP